MLNKKNMPGIKELFVASVLFIIFEDQSKCSFTSVCMILKLQKIDSVTIEHSWWVARIQ